MKTKLCRLLTSISFLWLKSHSPMGNQFSEDSPYLNHQLPKEINYSDEEIEQIHRWNKSHDRRCPIMRNAKNEKYISPLGTIGGGRTYSLTPTSIGPIMTVRCSCGEELVVDNNL
jgi:hypothetical protein